MFLAIVLEMKSCSLLCTCIFKLTCHTCLQPLVKTRDYQAPGVLHYYLARVKKQGKIFFLGQDDCCLKYITFYVK